jgi:hypothetical protein
MTTKVSASLTVSFSANDTASSNGLVLEIDDRETSDGGLNAGNTSFKPGDTVYTLLYKATDITLLSGMPIHTAGSYVSSGSGTRVVTEEYITFTDSREGSLQYPASTGVTFSWIGNPVRTDGKTTPITIDLSNQQDIQLSGTVVGVLKASYSANYTAYKLSGVPNAINQVLLFFAGERP